MSNETVKRGALVVLCGRSGVGKSTISRKLAEKTKLKYIVSATTRARNPKDDEGEA